MTGIVEFLTARLDEEQRRAAQAGGGKWSWEQEYGDMCGDPDCPYGQLMAENSEGLTLLMEVHGYDVRVDGWEGAGHIAYNDPARVLADVAAKRRIIAACDYDGMTAEYVLQSLAQPYAGHPDFDPSWGQQ